MRFGRYTFHIVAAILVLAELQTACAQPSGGPYGPVGTTYEIPPGARTVYYVAPDGGDDASGRTPEKPTTIEAAIEKAGSGDAVILRGGTYRTGDLAFNQRIILQPYRDERPVLKGTRVATDWERLRGNLWRTKWSTLFPLSPQPWWRPQNNVRSTPVYMFNNDMVFIDGELLETRGYPAELDEHSYCVDYEEGYIYIGANPNDRVVEITAYDNALTRTVNDVNGKRSDRLGPIIRGIVFTQYAYRAIEIEGYDPEGLSPEAEHGKDVVGTVLEDCTISYCSRVAAYLRGDKMVIRRNLISDTATEGLFILASSDVLLEKNIITRNNEEGIQGYYATAVKIFNQCYRVTCRDNLVIDNKDSSGIWYDVGNVDSVVVDNWVENTDNGFFMEISKGAVCAGNVFVNCGTGTKVLNSSGAKICQNTYINSRAAFDRDLRGDGNDHFGWHPSTGPGVEEREGHAFGNNLIVAYGNFNSPLFHAGQHRGLTERLKESMFDYANHNVYVRGRAGSPSDRPSSYPLGRDYIQDAATALVEWAPLPDEEENSRSFATLEEFQSLVHGFEQDSRLFSPYDGPLFKSRIRGDYTVVPSAVSQVKGAQLPPSVASLLPDEYQSAVLVGAFQAAVE